MRQLLHRYAKGDNYNGAIYGSLQKIFKETDPQIEKLK